MTYYDSYSNLPVVRLNLRVHNLIIFDIGPVSGLASRLEPLTSNFWCVCRCGLSLPGSPNVIRRVANHTMSLPANESAVMRPANSVPAFQMPDSSSNTSSCNSSTPSSPALFITSCPTPPSPQPSPQIQITSDTQFQFPGELGYFRYLLPPTSLKAWPHSAILN